MSSEDQDELTKHIDKLLRDGINKRLDELEVETIWGSEEAKAANEAAGTAGPDFLGVRKIAAFIPVPDYLLDTRTPEECKADHDKWLAGLPRRERWRIRKNMMRFSVHQRFVRLFPWRLHVYRYGELHADCDY